MNPELQRLLKNQFNVVSRQQCLGAGLTERQIEWMVTSGRLERLFAGVFADPTTRTSIEQRAMAATLAAGHHSWVSHRMAIALWGMRNYRCDLYEVTSVRTLARPKLIAHKCRSEPESTTRQGISVTTTARTLLDAATVVSSPILGRFLEIWLSTGVVKLMKLEEVMSDNRHHPGCGPLTRALDARTIGTAEADSPAESALGSLLVRHRLPTPTLHHLVSVSTGAVFELDWSYPELMLAFELDGYGVHLRSLAAFENDRIRRNELVLDGWLVLNFTTRMLTNKPQTIVGHVRRAIESRTAPDNPH